MSDNQLPLPDLPVMEPDPPFPSDPPPTPALPSIPYDPAHSPLSVPDPPEIPLASPDLSEAGVIIIPIPGLPGPLQLNC